MAKNGWGAAKPGKVIKSSDSEGKYGDYKMTDVKSSSDLNGLNAQYQGKTLTGDSSAQ